LPLNESKRKVRERWPLEFDLEGIPRDHKTREQLLQERYPNLETESPPMSPTNRFAIDKAGPADFLSPEQKAALLDQLLKEVPTGRVIDLNNPPRMPYQFREFPKLVYHHESGRVLEVSDRVQLQAALNRGFDEKPAPTRDYSQIHGGVAKPAEAHEPRPEELSAEELAALDAVDRGEVEEEASQEPEPGQQTGQQTGSRSRRRA